MLVFRFLLRCFLVWPFLFFFGLFNLLRTFMYSVPKILQILFWKLYAFLGRLKFWSIFHKWFAWLFYRYGVYYDNYLHFFIRSLFVVFAFAVCFLSFPLIVEESADVQKAWIYGEAFYFFIFLQTFILYFLLSVSRLCRDVFLESYPFYLIFLSGLLIGSSFTEFFSFAPLFADEALYVHLLEPLTTETRDVWGGLANFPDVFHRIEEEDRFSFFYRYAVFLEFLFPLFYFIANWCIFAFWNRRHRQKTFNFSGFHPYMQHSLGRISLVDKEKRIFIRKLRWLLRHQPWKADAFLRLFNSEVALLFDDFEEFGSEVYEFGDSYTVSHRILEEWSFLTIHDVEEEHHFIKDSSMDAYFLDEDDMYWTLDVLNQTPGLLNSELVASDRDLSFSFLDEVEESSDHSLTQYLFWRYKFLLVRAYFEYFKDKRFSTEFKHYFGLLTHQEFLKLNERFKKVYSLSDESFVMQRAFGWKISALDRSFFEDREEDVFFEDAIGGRLTDFEIVPRDYQFDPMVEALLERELVGRSGFKSGHYLSWRERLSSFLGASDEITKLSSDENEKVMTHLSLLVFSGKISASGEVLRDFVLSGFQKSNLVRAFEAYASFFTNGLGIYEGRVHLQKSAVVDYEGLAPFVPFFDTFKLFVERDFLFDHYFEFWAVARFRAIREIVRNSTLSFCNVHYNFYVANILSNNFFFDKKKGIYVAWIPFLGAAGLLEFSEAYELQARFPYVSKVLVSDLEPYQDTSLDPWFLFDKSRDIYSSLLGFTTEEIDFVTDFYLGRLENTLRFSYSASVVRDSASEPLSSFFVQKVSEHVITYNVAGNLTLPYPEYSTNHFQQSSCISSVQPILDSNRQVLFDEESVCKTFFSSLLPFGPYYHKDSEVEPPFLEQRDFYRNSDLAELYCRLVYGFSYLSHLDREVFKNSLGVWFEKSLTSKFFFKRASQSVLTVAIYNFIFSRLLFLTKLNSRVSVQGFVIGGLNENFSSFFDTVILEETETLHNLGVAIGPTRKDFPYAVEMLEVSDFRYILPNVFNQGVHSEFFSVFSNNSVFFWNAFVDGSKYAGRRMYDFDRLTYEYRVKSSSWGLVNSVDYTDVRVVDIDLYSDDVDTV